MFCHLLPPQELEGNNTCCQNGPLMFFFSLFKLAQLFDNLCPCLHVQSSVSPSRLGSSAPPRPPGMWVRRRCFSPGRCCFLFLLSRLQIILEHAWERVTKEAESPPLQLGSLSFSLAQGEEEEGWGWAREGGSDGRSHFDQKQPTC